jgi:hypothetical protein
VDWSVDWDALVFALFPAVALFVVWVAVWHIEENAESEKVIAGLVSGKGLGPASEAPEGQAPVAPCQWRVVVEVTWTVTDSGERDTVYSMHLETIHSRLQPGGGPQPGAFDIQHQVIDPTAGTSAVWAGAFRDAFTGTDSPWWDVTSMPAPPEPGQGAGRQPPRRRGPGRGARRRPSSRGPGGA